MPSASLQELRYEEALEQFAGQLDSAEAVMVGTGAAFQRASGLRFYRESDKVFHSVFEPWAAKYGFKNAAEALEFNYSSSEDRWALLATHAHYLNAWEPSVVYDDLKALLDGKHFHIVTIAHDGQLQKVFGEEHVSIILGDYLHWQCYQRCHDKVYPCSEELEKIYRHVDGRTISSELVPRCPKCGAEMEPWVGGYRFLEGEQYEAEYGKWEQFVLSCQNEQTLFLELGLSRKRKELIRQPMYHFAMSWERGFYTNINADDAMVPRELDTRSLSLEYDIDRVLRDARVRLGK